MSGTCELVFACSTKNARISRNGKEANQEDASIHVDQQGKKFDDPASAAQIEGFIAFHQLDMI